MIIRKAKGEDAKEIAKVHVDSQRTIFEIRGRNEQKLFFGWK